MADITLSAKSPLDGLDVTVGECRLREVQLALASVAIPLKGERALAKALKSHFALGMPDAKLTTVAGFARAARTGPDQLMLLLEDQSAADVQSALSDVAYVTDQSDNWVQCEISGSGALAALERICPIDLHDASFPEHAYARTVMEHMGAAILRTGPQTWLLMSASSSAKSFAHAVELSMTYSAG